MTPDQSNEFFTKHFAKRRMMVILRGHPSAQALALAESAWEAGLPLVEVPLQGDTEAASLEALVSSGARRSRTTGAGTVTTVELVERAAKIGARFTVAPGWDAGVLARSLALDLPHLPGVATGTEVPNAMSHGLRWLKGFPASTLGSAWFSAMRGPFPEASIVATGGITLANAAEFLDAGAAAVSVGSLFASMSPQQLRALG